MKKKLATLFMVFSVVILASINPVSAAKKAYIKTSTGSKVTVYCGKTLNLKAKTVNRKKKITYRSSNASVASVSTNGIVTAKKYGNTVITLKASGMKAKKVKVTVASIETASKITLKRNQTYQIKAKSYPNKKQMAASKFTYKSSNTKVATVSSNGKITAKSGGYAKIQMTAKKNAGKIYANNKKYVEVFIYDGFDQVCSETNGNQTIFTVNPNWKAITVNFKANNGKIYAYEFDGIQMSFDMLDRMYVGTAASNGKIRVEKTAQHKLNIQLIETKENYDVYVDKTRCQMTFYKSLKDANGNLRVSFDIKK